MLALTEANEKLLNDVQAKGNRVTWQSDMETWAKAEYWAYPKQVGRNTFEDCDGIALYKAKLLIDAGVPREDALMTICTDPTGAGHAVLCVTTDKGDLILDCNHVQTVTPAQMKTEGYTFLYRQHPGAGIDQPWDNLTE